MEIRLKQAAQRGIQFINEGCAMVAATAEAVDMSAFDRMNALDRALATIDTGEKLIRAVMHLTAADLAKLPSEVA